MFKSDEVRKKLVDQFMKSNHPVAVLVKKILGKIIRGVQPGFAADPLNDEHASFESHSRKNKQSRILKSNSVYFGGEDEIRTRGRITPTSV